MGQLIPDYAPDGRPFEVFYEDHFRILAHFGASKFNLPLSYAEQLAHDALLASVRHLSSVTNARSWLIAAVTRAACDHESRTEHNE